MLLSHTLGFSSRTCFPVSRSPNCSISAIWIGWEFSKASSLGSFLLRVLPSIHLFPLTFYCKQQERDQAILSTLLLKRSQLNIQVYHLQRSAFHVTTGYNSAEFSFTVCVTRIPFTSVSNNTQLDSNFRQTMNNVCSKYVPNMAWDTLKFKNYCLTEIQM